MAVVTGYTAEHMDEIVNATIASGSVVGDDLILTRNDDTTINAGNVRGPQGIQGIQGDPGPGNATDTDVAALINTPASLSQGAVDDRVSRVEVITDWNNAVEPGVHYYGAAGAANSPGSGGYVGTVLMDDTGKMVQTLYRNNISSISNREIWHRSYQGAGPTWTSWLSLFKDTGWVNLTLASGFSTSDGREAPAYRVRNGVAYFKGGVKRTSGADFAAGSTYAIANAEPAILLPSDTYNTFNIIAGGVSGAFGRFYVNMAPDVSILVGPTATANFYLGGASYLTASV